MCYCAQLHLHKYPQRGSPYVAAFLPHPGLHISPASSSVSPGSKGEHSVNDQQLNTWKHCCTFCPLLTCGCSWTCVGWGGFCSCASGFWMEMEEHSFNWNRLLLMVNGRWGVTFELLGAAGETCWTSLLFPLACCLACFRSSLTTKWLSQDIVGRSFRVKEMFWRQIQKLDSEILNSSVVACTTYVCTA